MKQWVWWVLGSLAFVVLLLFLPIGGSAQVPTVILDWTAPGDDGNVGTATSYQMRWSTARPDTTSQATIDTWWATATPVLSLPVPLVAGTRQSVTVSPGVGPFLPGSYYFVAKACDEVPNCSLYSNVATKVVPDATPPARIIDLVVR